MPKSQNYPALSLFVVLGCLAVMLVTAVNIWNDAARSGIAHSSSPGQNGQLAATSEHARTPNHQHVATKPLAPRYGAEIHAEVVLARPARDLDVPTGFRESASHTLHGPEYDALTELPAIPSITMDPAALEVPIQIETPSLDGMAAGDGLEQPPSLSLSPLPESAEFPNDVAMEHRGIETHIGRRSPIAAPPTAVVAPTSPRGMAPSIVANDAGEAPSLRTDESGVSREPADATASLSPPRGLPASPLPASPLPASPSTRLQTESGSADDNSQPWLLPGTIAPDSAISQLTQSLRDEAPVQFALPTPPIPPAQSGSTPHVGESQDILFADSLRSESGPIAQIGEPERPVTTSIDPLLSAPARISPEADSQDDLPRIVELAVPDASDAPERTPEPSDDVASQQQPVSQVAEGNSAAKSSVEDAILAARRAAESRQTVKAQRTIKSRRPSAWPSSPGLAKDLQPLLALKDRVGTQSIVDWAQQIESSVAELHQSTGLFTHDARPPLRKLHYLVEHTPQTNDSQLQSRIMVARYAIQRRLAIWDYVQKAMHPDVAQKIDSIQSAVDDNLTLRIAHALRQQLTTGQGNSNWPAFLRLDDVEGLAQSTDSRGSHERSSVGASVLERMNRPDMTPAQQAVVHSPLGMQLQSQLRGWSTVQIDYRRWLAAVERQESEPSFRNSRELANVGTRLKWSHVPEQNQLANTFYSHYRNANTRVAVTETLLNQMLPVIRDVQTPVRDQILGARVFGNSTTWTKIRLDLVPDPSQLRLRLIANGSVNAQTWSYKGPARVLNRNQSEFHLQKMLTFDRYGNAQVGKSMTTASTRLNVLGLRTQYDGIPLIGRVVRGKVRDEINATKNRARNIISSRVTKQAETMVDSQLTQALVSAEQRLEEKLVQPLRQLQLNPTTVSLQTTQDRVVYRGRLAAQHHLGAFTPRPNALANSMASIQLHESSINNAIERLHIDGRRGDLRKMLEEAANSRPNMNFNVPEDVPENVTVEFAEQDAISLRWDDGAMQISIRVAEIAFKRRAWKNFTVSARYKPSVKGLDAELYRDGIVELKSQKRLPMRDQVALRGIFSKVFSKNRNIALMPESFSKDNRLADLQFTQFVIRDGWIGISIGKQRNSEIARPMGTQRR